MISDGKVNKQVGGLFWPPGGNPYKLHLANCFPGPVIAWGARKTLATRSRHARDTLATFPRLRAPLQALLQAFYRALELQFLCYTQRY